MGLLTFGFALMLVNGEQGQDVKGRGELASGLSSPLALSHAGGPAVRPRHPACNFRGLLPLVSKGRSFSHVSLPPSGISVTAWMVTHPI